MFLLKNQYISMGTKEHYLINFKKEESGVKGKTKFGGQPDWVDKPEWPIGAEFGEPMHFVCQIELETIGFTDFEAKFAYLFLSDPELDTDTWDPNGGENAIILQPGDNSRFDLKQMNTGPSISHRDNENDNKGCGVDLKPLAEKTEQDIFIKNKFRGEPEFWQDEAYPYTSKSRIEIVEGKEVEVEEEWHLLIQLHDEDVPYFVNFGTGMGYGFIRNDGKAAKFLWQCD